ncbi:hypothetical protein KY358_01380 [Candidatus Woesearchaeota archaeon]|nr:hypothetical protein [Candidatus Woesearchaeota archaeon]
MMVLNKRAMILYYPVIFFLAISLLLFYGLNCSRNLPKETEFIGEVFLDSYKLMYDAIKIKKYIDQSAEYAFYDAVYDLGSNGGFHNSECGKYVYGDDGYSLWETFESEEGGITITTECYPEERDLAVGFSYFLNRKLDVYLKAYPAVPIPLDNYDFTFENKGDTIMVNGIAAQDLIVSSEEGHSDYSLKPSFSYEGGYNFIDKFEEYGEKAKEIKESVVECLKKGSYEADDGDDFIVCSDKDRIIKGVKGEDGVEGIEDYEIIPIVPIADAPAISGEESKLYPEKTYTLLVKIKDGSFENPYYEKEMIAKYGLRFKDDFEPPATEIITDEEGNLLEKGEDGWYLTWRNNASDASSYKVYYKKIINIGGKDSPSKPPISTGQMNKLEIPITKGENNILLDGFEGRYYFAVTAEDDAGNEMKEIIAKRVNIPPSERGSSQIAIEP